MMKNPSWYSDWNDEFDAERGDRRARGSAKAAGSPLEFGRARTKVGKIKEAADVAVAIEAWIREENPGVSLEDLLEYARAKAKVVEGGAR